MIYLNLTKIRSFVSVAEHGSFRKAAESINLSQPALSAHVRSLEAVLGMPLLHRTTRSVHLTTAGANFLARTRRAIAELEAGVMELQDQASLQRGRVVIGCVPTIASTVLPEVLVDFTRRYPGVAIRVLDVGAQELHRLVLNREVDIAIGPRPDRSEDLDFCSIARDHFVAVCSRDHILASHVEVRLADLAGYPFLVVATGTNVRGLLEQAFKQQGFEFRPAYEFMNHYTLGGMIQAGVGITAMPSMSISMLSYPLLKAIRIVEPEIVREVGLLQRRDQIQTPALHAFHSALAAGFKRLKKSVYAAPRGNRKGRSGTRVF